jgi:hypothetical protein
MTITHISLTNSVPTNNQSGDTDDIDFIDPVAPEDQDEGKGLNLQKGIKFVDEKNDDDDDNEGESDKEADEVDPEEAIIHEVGADDADEE